MPDQPVVPVQDLFLGIASAAVLFAGLIYWIRAGIDRLRRDDSLRSDEPELFSRVPLDQSAAKGMIFVSLFAHIFGVALIPWVRMAFPDQLPFDFTRYDLVLVQFKTRDAPLRLPANVAAAWAPSPTTPSALASADADPGRGDGQVARNEADEAGGEGEASTPRRFEIEFPARKAPENPTLEAPELALEATAPTASRALRALLADASLFDPADLVNPALPALARLDVDPPTIPMRSTALWTGGPLARWFGGAAGLGADDGFGDGAASGAAGEDGQGFGRGLFGRGPLPRKLHGIIVISNDASAIPEAREVLTGNPVYTVYLEVPGFERKWVLQVCVPSARDDTLRYRDGVLRVLSRKPLDPPFALRKELIDAEELLRGRGAPPPRLVVYATVDEEGDIGNLRVVSGLDPGADELVLAKLREWEFHPAYRDGEPVAVEAVFGIPLY